jgi:hypothetical protein
MPTYAYSGLSSTSSSADPQASEVERAADTPLAELAAVGIHETKDFELADFEKVVDSAIAEFQKFETERNRALILCSLTASLCLILGFLTVSEVLLSGFLTITVILSAATFALGMLFIIGLMMERQSIARRRRTCEELAELVREIAPAFMPRMSVVRRAEIKIRLSNMGIYDPLKYR